jgi:hypothetical protein
LAVRVQINCPCLHSNDAKFVTVKGTAKIHKISHATNQKVSSLTSTLLTSQKTLMHGLIYETPVDNGARTDAQTSTV